MERTIGFGTVFVALLFAHLLGDFLTQTGKLVDGKMHNRPTAFLRHGLHHVLLSLLVLQPFVSPRPFGGWTVPVVLLGMTVVHVAIDVWKIRLGASASGAAAFLGDQALHVGTLLAAAALIAPIRIPRSALLPAWIGGVEDLYAPGAVVVATILGAGWVIRLLLAPFEPDAVEEGRVELANAGMVIGWLERALVLLAVVARSPEAVGFVVAAKSIVRFPSLKDRPFAEYFLVGTMLSVLVAVIGGLILLAILPGLG